MKNRDELYVLQDGTHADPGEVSPGKDGVLRHKNGLAVCLYADGRPQTVGEDAERNGNVLAAKAGEGVDAQRDAIEPPPVLPVQVPIRAAPAATPAAAHRVDATDSKAEHPKDAAVPKDVKPQDTKPQDTKPPPNASASQAKAG